MRHRQTPEEQRAAQHARCETHGRREQQATALLGIDVRHVPKATLAVVAVYLALAVDEEGGFDAARERLWQEWRVLHAQGIVETPPPVDR